MAMVSDNVGDSNVSSESASQPVNWLNGALNPLTWSFMSEPAWKWAMFVIALSLFAGAWKGVLRYMK